MSYRNEAIIALFGALAGFSANIAYDHVKPPDKEATRLNELLSVQTTELTKQAAAFNQGFDKLSRALINNTAVDPGILQIVKGLSGNLDELNQSSRRISDNASSVLKYAGKAGSTSTDDSDIRIFETENTAVAIDSKNQIAVLRDLRGDGKKIQVNLNGKKMYMETGDRREYSSVKNEDCYIVYTGKMTYSFNFSMQCN